MKNTRTGSRIFMTELMFSILYFIVIAAICVQCFAGSYSMSREAGELTRAVNIASNAAERFYAIDEADSFTEYYDEKWEISESENGKYRATGIVSSEVGDSGLLYSMSITVTRVSDERELYSLDVKKAVGSED